MPSCKVHPGNVLLLPAQPKLPPAARAGAIPFLPTPLLNIHAGKEVPPKPGQLHQAVYPARLACAGAAGEGGSAGGAASTVLEQLPTRQREQTTTCPRQPELAPGLRHSPAAPGGEPGSNGQGRAMHLQTGVQARSSTASPKARLASANGRCREPRHARGDAATRLGDRGTWRCHSAGPGPGRTEMLEGLPSPAAQCRGKPSAAGSLQRSDSSSSSSPCTRMLLPHHPPRFAPSSPETWRCPPPHVRRTFPHHPFQPRTPACGISF